MGRALCGELSDKHEIAGLDLRKSQIDNFIEADIAQRDETFEKIIKQRPEIVIHAAAYIDVDGCELNPEKAKEVNALGTKNVAQACKECNCLLIYISTDFVFDGEKKSPYIESDQPKPINIYGRSKLEGEEFIPGILKKFVIVRSSWLFGKGGTNFVDTILQKAKTEESLKVVNDQYGSPTYTPDLAKAIAKLIELSDKINGLYHITNSDSCSWYEFALAIKEFASFDANIVPIPSEQYPSRTKRPKMSILENQRYRELVAGENLRHWKEALEEYLLG